MDLATARDAARHWVTAVGRTRPGYLGAYLVGSTTGLPDGAPLPLGSDVDVMLVTRQPPTGFKLGKFEHRGVLLEVSHLAWPQLGSADAVLTDYHLAAGLARDTVLDDPTGALTALQREVAARFADPELVRARCRGVRERIATGLAAADESAPWHTRVTGWLFPTGVTAHLVLVAALRNPTVRLRYLRAREALAEFGLAERYPELLGLLGAERLTPEQVRGHVDSLAVTFDAAAAAARTPFPFSTDITGPARPIAVDACYELVARGDHREAMFWIVATFARCHAVLAADAPRAGAALAPHFDAAVADLGITSGRELRRRAEATLAALPGLWETAEEIISGGAVPAGPHLPGPQPTAPPPAGPQPTAP